MNFSDITIVSVTGHDDYTLGSMYAIQESCLQMPGAKGLLVSPTRPDHLPPYIQHISCKPFSYLEYNYFILYHLAALIQTEYCLIVQQDGWVINGQNWRDEFFNYDYIGGVIPNLLEEENGRLHFRSNEHWFQHADGQYSKMLLNGGLSLRSKRLLEISSLLAQQGILFQQESRLMQTNDGRIYLDWENPFNNEDIFLTGKIRGLLEYNGFQFPNGITASYFAAETLAVINKLGVPLSDCLGFHFPGLVKLEENKKIRLTPKLLAIFDQIPELAQAETQTLREVIEPLGYQLIEG